MLDFLTMIKDGIFCELCEKLMIDHPDYGVDRKPIKCDKCKEKEDNKKDP